MEHRLNETDRQNPKYSEKKTCSSATLSTANPTWTDPATNSGLRGDRPATNRLNHGTAKYSGHAIYNMLKWRSCCCTMQQGILGVWRHSSTLSFGRIWRWVDKVMQPSFWPRRMRAGTPNKCLLAVHWPSLYICNFLHLTIHSDFC
jgi:hypothetical protein